MLKAEDLDRLAELEREATAGPWKAFENGAWGGQGFGVSIGDDTKEWLTTEPDASNGKNALLLAALRNAAPALIAAAREGLRLRSELQATEKREREFISDCDRLAAEVARLREALERIASWEAKVGAPRSFVANEVRAALTPEASHD